MAICLNFHFCDGDFISATNIFGELWSIQIYLSMYQLHIRIGSKGLSPGTTPVWRLNSRSPLRVLPYTAALEADHEPNG
jgi:hypothetical protein